MKRIFIFFLISCTAYSLSAQEDTTSWKRTLPRHELQLGIGDPLIPSLYAGRINFPNSFFFNEISSDNSNQWFEPDAYRGATIASGAISANYMFRITKWFWVGGTLSYSGFYNNVYHRVSNKKVDYNHTHFIAVIPSIRFSWINQKYVTLYSGLGIGAATVLNKTNDEITFAPHLVGQLTAVGVQAGKNWYGFFEFGLGAKGIISTGFGYHFKPKN